MSCPCGKCHCEICGNQMERDKLKAERDELKERIFDLEVKGVHLCHDQCQKPICKANRERDKYRAALEKVIQRMTAAGLDGKWLDEIKQDIADQAEGR